MERKLDNVSPNGAIIERVVGYFGKSASLYNFLFKNVKKFSQSGPYFKVYGIEVFCQVIHVNSHYIYH